MDQCNPRRQIDKDAVLKAVDTLERNRTGVVLSGRVVGGKVQLDQDCLDRISKEFPDADMSFVAVNAPFEPDTLCVKEST